MNDAIGKYARVYCDDPAYVKLMEEDLRARDPEKEGQAWGKVSRFVANLYGLNCIAYPLFSLNVSFIFLQIIYTMQNKLLEDDDYEYVEDADLLINDQKQKIQGLEKDMAEKEMELQRAKTKLKKMKDKVKELESKNSELEEKLTTALVYCVTCIFSKY